MSFSSQHVLGSLRSNMSVNSKYGVVFAICVCGRGFHLMDVVLAHDFVTERSSQHLPSVSNTCHIGDA